MCSKLQSLRLVEDITKKHPTEFSGKGHPKIHRLVTMIPAEPR